MNDFMIGLGSLKKMVSEDITVSTSYGRYLSMSNDDPNKK
jgi:hypothetical protein